MPSPVPRSRSLAVVAVRVRPPGTQDHQHGGYREARDRPVCNVVHAGGAAGVCPRDGAPPFVRVRAGDRGLHRRRARPIPAARSLSGASRSAGGAIRLPPASRRRRSSRPAGGDRARRRRSAPRPSASATTLPPPSRLFADFEKVDQPTRLRGLSRCDGRLSPRKYADDPEASAFYAVALVGVERSDRPDVREPAEGWRDPRAARADAARSSRASCTTSSTPTTSRRSRPRPSRPRARYAKIAPSAPHALHMPSHTFTRLGYWQDSIDTNIASASRRPARGRHGRRAARDGLPGVRLSADWRRTAPRAAWSTRCPEIQARFDPDRGRFGRAAVRPASSRWRRFRRATRSSAGLGRGGEARAAPQPLPAGRRDDVVRARARRGAYRGSRQPRARQSTRCSNSRPQLAKAGESYWAEQVAIQRLGVAGVDGVQADGRTEEALTTMRRPPIARTGRRRTR